MGRAAAGRRRHDPRLLRHRQRRTASPGRAAACERTRPDPDPFFAAPAPIHGTAPDLSNQLGPAFAEDGLNLNYVKDTGRAIALLQLADRLDHRTYNIGSGRATTIAQVIEAIKKVVPDAHVDLPTGGDAQHLAFDISRLQEDTGYRAEYDTERAAGDYIAWLRAGSKS